MNQPCAAGPAAGVYADDPLPGAPDEPRPEERVDMCAIGQFRWEKGASLLLDVVRRVAAVRPAFSFFIQVHDRRAFEAQVRPQLDSIQKGVRGNVHIGDLDRDAYVRKLRAARTIVLPYRPERYALRISGVFAEAVAYGVPVVAPARTWMEDMLRAGYGAGILFTRFEADAVAAAVVSSLENAGHLRERAAVRRDEWRRKQSIDALVDHALAWQKS
jgi:glycosyltransferase involved in cell wall biosynthesis